MRDNYLSQKLTVQQARQCFTEARTEGESIWECKAKRGDSAGEREGLEED
jgi:hypothetical protein